MSTQRNRFSRREVLRYGAGTAGLATLANLTIMQSAAAASAQSGSYKALVCVFLWGGNDSFNLVVPTSAIEYGAYLASRPSLAVPQNLLLPITPATSTGVTYGVHPATPHLQGLFQSGKLAILGNVGCLVEPTSKATYANHTAERPPQLFSHADQQFQWQTSYAQSLVDVGWCGRVADNLSSLNAGAALSMNISLAGTNTQQVGTSSAPYKPGHLGPTKLTGFWGSQGTARRAAFDALLARQYTNKLEKSFAGVMNEAISIEALISGALTGAPALATPFPTSWLGKQLAMVAKMISVRGPIGLSRQIFFVGKGGFDTHDNQNTDQPLLYGDISQCLAAFQGAMEELGCSSDVTLFTASEFGRTLSSNGKGTDHGWGSHHLILGDAVAGGDIFGTMPDLTLDGPDDVGGGRMVPTTSVEQYTATLAAWFGVDVGDLPAMFPNLANFGPQTLGFMT
jgi:uncharacterized protein (DUF1501 family)